MSSYTISSNKQENALIPYTTDVTTSSHKTNSLPKLINLEHRPSSQCSSPTSLGRMSKQKDKFYVEWEKMQAAGCWDETRRTSRSSGSGSHGGSGSSGHATSNQTSIRGSHEQLIKLAGITVDKSAWSNVTGFAAACFGFTLNYHTLYLLPLSVIKHGGLAFLIIYCIMLLLLGTPLLLHEMLLGQFSSLSSVHIYYNLCPLMAGLGVAMYVTVLIRAVLNISVIVWVSRSLYDIFTLFDADSGIKSIKDVAKLQTETPSVDGLFSLEYSELITLGVVIILIFLLGLTGVAGMGRISQLCVAASLLLVITLTVRCCLASDGGQAVSELLKPDWSHLTQPLTWVEASTQVIMSLYLGLGVFSTFSSHNSYSHNIVRDTMLVIGGHIVWTVVTTVMVSAIMGMSQVNVVTNSTGVVDCLVKSSAAMSSISQGWLWLGLIFILIIIITINNTLGYITVIISIIPKLKRAIAIPISLALLFFLSLIICNEAGPYIFQFISLYLSSWPPILFSLVSVLLLSWCHDIRYLESDLTSMTSMLLPHIFTTHLSSLLYIFIPVMLTASLVISLQNLVETQLILVTTTVLPAIPLVLGSVIMTVRALRKYPRIVQIKSLVRPTDIWFKQHQRKKTGSGNKM